MREVSISRTAFSPQGHGLESATSAQRSTMQAKRVIATCVLLAAVSFGQSSSSSTTSPSSGSDQNASADQGQSGQPAQPVSPLEEPKKPSESDQAKPQASTFDLGGSANTGQDQQ